MKPLKPPTETHARVTRQAPRKDSAQAEVLDFVLARIEAHPMVLGDGLLVRKDRLGYSLFVVVDGEPVARLRSLEKRRRFEVLCWGRGKRAWRPINPRKRTILPLEEALDFINEDPLACFWI